MLEATIGFEDFKGTIEKFLAGVNFLSSKEFLDFVDKRVREHFKYQFDVGGIDPETGGGGVWKENAGKYAKWKMEFVGHNAPGRFLDRMYQNTQDAYLDIGGNKEIPGEGNDAEEVRGIIMVWSWFEADPVRKTPPPWPNDEDTEHRPYDDYQTYYQEINHIEEEYMIHIAEPFAKHMIEEALESVLA